MRRLAVAVLAAAVTLGAAGQRPGLAGGTEIARAYDAIFDARFDALPGLLADTCPPAPAEGCQLLEVVSLLWQIQLDPHNLSRDSAFRRQADAAVTALEGWTRREPARAEAWFYLGGAYGARAQWRVLRNQTFAAAQDGKRIKEALERALALDPDLHDAWFGIGLYHYYADVAPAAAKMLRWLLLLPGGDRVEGLREMLRARSAGQLLRSEADYQLHLIYLWYEKQVPRALDLLRTLRDRHPRNPYFPQLVAEIEDTYLKDHGASLRTWQSLLDAARDGRVELAAMTETRARLGVALQFYRLGQHDAALPHLRAVIAAAPPEPYGAGGAAPPRCHRRGSARAVRLGLARAAPIGVRPRSSRAARRGDRRLSRRARHQSARRSAEDRRARTPRTARTRALIAPHHTRFARTIAAAL